MGNELFELWRKKADCFYQEELSTISQDDVAIEERFFQYVPFGTGGMRGKLGAGTNRINLVAEGHARQIERQGAVAKARGVVIAYDTRHFSQEFAYETACVLAAHAFKVMSLRKAGLHQS